MCCLALLGNLGTECDPACPVLKWDFLASVDVSPGGHFPETIILGLEMCLWKEALLCLVDRAGTSSWAETAGCFQIEHTADLEGSKLQSPLACCGFNQQFKNENLCIVLQIPWGMQQAFCGTGVLVLCFFYNFSRISISYCKQDR